ncbi:glycoside hydrolase family 18 protein [Suillus clintonianus]|uniref:glycoside hydrolase family 18 protein n=1 Tax=Suillus clintonianus TaxID=1904413 RepID=UPI001B85CD83|nr:glycoside hydrolase family 18 protein [Suillus clintonianus]KAG2127499.1 glycoside hydrolase family 18 protein [Suillus clintonianus]
MLPAFILPLIVLSAVSASPLAARSPTACSTTPISASWYTGWHATEGAPLSSVSWEKYNTIYYSFAETAEDLSSLSLAGSDGELLPQFVSEAHAHDVEAHIAVGGWTGSIWFSSHFATAKNRTAFVQTVTNFASKYNLDGIQFDWEYPNDQGLGCNTISVNDTANFLAFLQELRQNPVGATLTLSAAVTVVPFYDATGNPSTDVSGFSKVLDYIALMNYAIWGPWSPTVGPNAPLDDTCLAAGKREGSAVSAVKAWSDAGIPANQIVLGVPTYGHSYSVSPSDAFASDKKTLAAYPAFNASNQPLGDAWDNSTAGGYDACGVYGSGSGGTFNFRGLMDGGFLTAKGKPADGIHYRYDSCSQTPYVYNETSQVMISFDNVQSYAAKGKYIKNAGLRGFALWETGGDYNDMLLDSIIHAVGH